MAVTTTRRRKKGEIQEGDYIVRAPDGRLFAITSDFGSIFEITGDERQAVEERPDLWLDAARASRESLVMMAAACKIFRDFRAEKAKGGGTTSKASKT